MKISDIPESPRPKFRDEIHLDKSCLVLGDIEVPYHNAEWINQCIGLAKAWGIKTCVWAGDFVHLASLAHFPEAEKDLQREIDEVGELIEAFLKPFSEIVYMAGNHDRRPSMTLDRMLKLEVQTRLVVPPELAMEFKRKVRVSDYFYCWVNDWKIVHPKATNTVPANAARRIAENQGCNVVMTHNHLVGMQQAGKQHWAIEAGCCVDPERLGYYMMRDTTRPRMRNGALILRVRRSNGNVFTYPTLLSPDWTDFDFEMKKYANSQARK